MIVIISAISYNQTINSKPAFGARIENLPYIAKFLDKYLNEGEAAKFLRQMDKKKNVIQAMEFEGDKNVSIGFDRFYMTEEEATFNIESNLPEERGFAETEVIIPYKNRGKHIANRLINVIRKVIDSIANSPEYLSSKSRTVQNEINNPSFIPKCSSTIKMPAVESARQ